MKKKRARTRKTPPTQRAARPKARAPGPRSGTRAEPPDAPAHPRRGAQKPIADATLAHALSADHATMAEAVAAREVFWQNVIRQILSSLAVEGLNRAHAPKTLPPAADSPPPPAPDDLFDGRLGILTHAGERIPIAQVLPVLACGVPGTDASKLLSMAVECSVFQVRTPTGEVFTIPLREMRGFHSLTPELMRSLEEAARREAADEGSPAEGSPFGFAAFTSMARADRERQRGTAYPQHPPDAPNPHPTE